MKKNIKYCACGCKGKVLSRGKWLPNHKQLLAEKQLALTPNITCGCGCGGIIKPEPHHKYHPPTYLWGHGRVAATQIFLKENENKHICKCGCGEFIEILLRHKSQGIPNFKPRHHITNIMAPARTQSAMIHKMKLNKSKRFEFTFWQRVEILRKCNFACAVCAWCVDYTRLEFDHIEPIAIGGQTTVENGQMLCGPCHTEKTNKEIGDFQYNVWRTAKQIIQENN